METTKTVACWDRTDGRCCMAEAFERKTLPAAWIWRDDDGIRDERAWNWECQDEWNRVCDAGSNPAHTDALAALARHQVEAHGMVATPEGEA